MSLLLLNVKAEILYYKKYNDFYYIINLCKSFMEKVI